MSTPAQKNRAIRAVLVGEFLFADVLDVWFLCQDTEAFCHNLWILIAPDELLVQHSHIFAHKKQKNPEILDETFFDQNGP